MATGSPLVPVPGYAGPEGQDVYVVDRARLQITWANRGAVGVSEPLRTARTVDHDRTDVRPEWGDQHERRPLGAHAWGQWWFPTDRPSGQGLGLLTALLSAMLGHMPIWSKQLLWMCAQAYAVWWMTDGMIRDLGPQGAVGYLVMNIIIVAFMTALLTNLWDWVRVRTRGLPFRFGFALARLVGSVRHR